MALLEGQWLLEYPGVSQSWGGLDPVGNPFRLPRGIYNREAPTIGEVGVTTEDETRSRLDGVNMGQDFYGGRPITFSLGIKGTSEASALELLAELARAWRGESIRRTPGAYARLKTRNAGRDRMVYGRPRRFVPVDTFRHQGILGAEATFDTTDANFYAHDSTGLSVPFVPTPTGGFAIPASVPWTSSATATTSGGILVEGDLPVWPILQIRGPILNPAVELVNQWTLRFNLQLLAGQILTVDTRPATRSVTGPGGASFRGSLTRTSRLDRASLAPGSYAVSLSGIDTTGLSAVAISWHRTYTSL